MLVLLLLSVKTQSKIKADQILKFRKTILRFHYLQLPISKFWSYKILNIATTSFLEIFCICCWYSSWSLLDEVTSIFTNNIIFDASLSLLIGLTSGLVAYLLQIPLLLAFQ